MSGDGASASAEIPTTSSDVRDRYPYKMKELCELTGLARQAIHFYIQQGVVPAGHKTGRNMAFYGEEHVERLVLVRKLQHERFLPLKAIRAMLDGRDEQFSRQQKRFLGDVRSELASTLARGTDAARERIEAAPLMKEHGLTRDELDRIVQLGVVAAEEDADGRVWIAAEDAWVFENFGNMRAAGFTPELGFEIEDLSAYVEAVDTLIRRDVELVSQRLSHLPPAVAARMLERAVPLLTDFLVRYHARRVSDFLSSI